MRAAVLFAASLCLAAPALAGAPLACHPFATAGEPSLPWEGGARGRPRADYDTKRLVPDTLAILDGGAGIFARMETLRRAVSYAREASGKSGGLFARPDATLARELLDRLVARAHEKSPPRRAMLAEFDAGFVIECLKQTYGKESDAAWAALDGRAYLKSALAASGGDPAIELALGLAELMGDRTSGKERLTRLASGAAPDSLLRRNLDAFTGWLE